MEISQNGIDFIKSCEAFRAVVYQDQAGIWTMGYGTTNGAAPGMEVTPAGAEAMLREDLEHVQQIVNDNCEVPLNQNQFDAVCSFAYNCGVNAFLCSHLRSDLNGGNYLEAADQFLKWKYVHGVVNQGLLNRREKEGRCFCHE